jgi:hypothetical protein
VDHPSFGCSYPDDKPERELKKERIGGKLVIKPVAYLETYDGGLIMIESLSDIRKSEVF